MSEGGSVKKTCIQSQKLRHCWQVLNGQTHLFEGLAHKVIPDAVLNKKADLNFPIMLAAAAIQEMQYVGHSIINVVVPAAVVTAMGKMDWKSAGAEVEAAADQTRTIPGAKAKAREVARLAARMMKDWE